MRNNLQQFQQGETMLFTITLSAPLEEDAVLYYAVSDSYEILLEGNSADGGITKVDNQHYVIRLSSEETFDLKSCYLELAYSLPGKTKVCIADSAIKLEFRPNKIKKILQ